MIAADTVSTPPMMTFKVPLIRVRSLRISSMSCLRATSDQPEGGRCSISMFATSSPRCERSPSCMSNRCASLIVIVNPFVWLCTAMCAIHVRNGNTLPCWGETLAPRPDTWLSTQQSLRCGRGNAQVHLWSE